MLHGADATSSAGTGGWSPPGSGARPWPQALLLIALAAAYSNALAASFQFDDWDVIVRDPRVQSVSDWWSSMPGIRPLLKLSYALNHASGLGVRGFHAVNVAIHAGNALLVLALVRERLARSGPAAGTAGEAQGSTASTRFVALVAALVFALHPVQTEAVTYASGRSTSLSTGLALASLLVFVRTRRKTRVSVHGESLESDREWPTRGSCAISIALMLLGIAVKETAIVVPALVAIWVATDPDEHEPGRAALRASAAYALAALLGLVVALSLPAYRSLAATSFTTRSPLANLVAQTDGIAYLAGQLVRFDRLNADPALEAVTRLDPARALVAGVLVALLLAALANLRRRQRESFSVLWTFAWLAPTNSLVARLDLVNDRQLYGALVGPALLVGLAIDAVCRRARAHGRQQTVRLLVVAALALGLGTATHSRNVVYGDELAFWQDVARKSPQNARAFNNLGFARAERCELAAAAAAWRRALELDPELVRAAVNLRLLEEGAGQAERCPRADRE